MRGFLKEYTTIAVGSFAVAYTGSTVLEQKIQTKEDTLILGGLALVFPATIIGGLYAMGYELINPEKEIIWRVKVIEREKINKKD
jgi:hypothetical protein